MIKKVSKRFWVWEFEKEVQWLNEMSQKGWAFVKIDGFSYIFESCMPGEYIYRKQLLKGKANTPENLHYLSFLQETGAVMVDFRHYDEFDVAYFRRKAVLGTFELFSDKESIIEQITRIIHHQATIMCILILPFISIIHGIIRCFTVDNMLFMLVLEIPVLILYLILGGFNLYNIIQLRNKRKELKKEKQIYQ